MSSRLKLVLFTFAIALISVPRASAQAVVAVEENGRKVYVNDLAASAEEGRARRQTYRLVYWSQSEGRWKPVPGAQTMRAARSAASEVRQLLGAQYGMSGVNVPKRGAQAAPEANAAKPISPAADASSSTAAAVASAPVRRQAATAPQVDVAIEQAATRHHVDPNLVRAIVKVESNFNPRAVSRKGALGLMQLMPGTARELAVSNPFDPQQNMDAGVRHLKGLLDSYGGDVPLTLAAYNAGAGAVARNKGVPPYRETRDYVKRITELYGAKNATVAQLGSQIKVYRGPGGVLTISNTD